MPTLTAKSFVEKLKRLQSDKELEKIQRYFKSGKGQYGEGDQFIGVQMGKVFALAKEFTEMDLGEVEKLLESKIHEVRAGAVSIMDFQARHKKSTDERRKALFDLYIARHDRINNWDLVDRSAGFVVGSYLYDKPRKILYKLAKSRNMWERRTAIVSTSYFLRKGEAEDTFAIAEILMHDTEDLIHKAAGGWIREAGKKHKMKLLEFLDRYAATMPRTMLRYAIEKLPKNQRLYYLNNEG
ncbi:MAG TPA: DNA alkylation repair protein [Chryseosolibacter sp.]